MPRARYNIEPPAAAPAPRGSGCFSGYIIPPLAVLIVGTLLALFAWYATPQDITVQAADGSAEQPGAPQAALQLLQPNQALPAAVPENFTHLSPVFTPQIQYWRNAIARWAAAASLDPNLAAVVMQIESCGNPRATSHSGAMGLFQVMPYHFSPLDDPYSPDTNAARGLDYLRRSLAAAHNDARLALAGYNGGISVISRSEWTWPAETIRYAYWGGGIYADAAGGRTQSARLTEWLIAGGSGLCYIASQQLGLNP